MPKKKRIKTTFPGVYYIEGFSRKTWGKERIYYIRYRIKGKLIEKRVGREFQDSMTASKASGIRAECIAGKSLPLNERDEATENHGAEEPSQNRQLTEKILEKKKIEREPIESEKKFRSFMETASDLMCMTDKEGNFTYVNESMAKTLGYLKEEMIGMHITQILHKKNLEQRFKTKFEELIRKGKLAFETTWVSKEGKEIYGEEKVVAVYDSNGEFTETRGVLRDITKRKLTEQTLREREVELDIKNKSLEEMNAALRILLKRREEDKTELEEKVLLNIQELVLPFLEKLNRSGLDVKQRSFTSILESNLKDIVSPFSLRLSSKYMKFTPAEIQIANLIKQGKTTKEISALLNVSDKTIESHRKNIRLKIGIKNKKENLRTHLLNLSSR